VGDDDPDRISTRHRYVPLVAAWVVALAATAFLRDDLWHVKVWLVLSIVGFPAGLFYFAPMGWLLGLAVYGVLLRNLVRTTEKRWYRILLAVFCVRLAINVYGCQHVRVFPRVGPVP
jgi:hypothetical protein